MKEINIKIPTIQEIEEIINKKIKYLEQELDRLRIRIIDLEIINKLKKRRYRK